MDVGERLGQIVVPGTVIAMRGGLGAGKTTFAKGFAKGLAINEDITSPSYTLIREYQGRLPFYHMDAYRLSGEEDFRSIGAEDFMYGKGVCLIEWSERVEQALPPGCAKVTIDALDTGERRITIEDSLLETIGS